GTAGQKLELTVVRLSARDGHNDGYAQVEVPMGEAMGAAAAQALAGTVGKDDPRKGGPVTHFERKGSGAGKKVAGYVLVGTGAALLGGGAFFGLQASNANASFHNTPQTNTNQSESLRRTGQTY